MSEQNVHMKMKAEQPVHLGSFFCKNCGATAGYYDVDEMKDVCPFCGNPNFDREESENVDGYAIEALKCCAAGRFDAAKEMVKECKVRNPAAVATALAELGYAYGMYDANRPADSAAPSYYERNALGLLDKFLDANRLTDPKEVRLYETLHRSAEHDGLAVLITIYELAAARIPAHGTQEDACGDREAAEEERMFPGGFHTADRGGRDIRDAAEEERMFPGGFHTADRGGWDHLDAAEEERMFPGGGGADPRKRVEPFSIQKRALTCYKLLDPDHLMTQWARKIVLIAALNRGDWARARAVATNTRSCLYGREFKGFAILPILRKYPEEEGKEQLVSQIADQAAFRSLPDSEIPLLEEYLRTTGDSLSVRLAAVRNTPGTNAFPGGGKLLEILLPRAKAEGRTQELFSMICAASSAAGMEAVQYLLGSSRFEDFEAMIEALRNSPRRARVQAEGFREFLLRRDISGDEKAAVVRGLMTLPASMIFKRGIRGIYLCDAKDEGADRMKVLDTLISKDNPVETETVERYLMRCGQDGERKPEIIRKIYQAGFRMTDSLRKQYLAESVDDPEVREQVIAVLERRTPQQKKRRSAWHFW